MAEVEDRTARADVSPARRAGRRDRAREDYRGRSHLVVWFTKGMACPFCRTQMSQLARGYQPAEGRSAPR